VITYIKDNKRVYKDCRGASWETHDYRQCDINEAEFFEIDGCSYGDYIGGLVERVNHETLIKILESEGIEYILKVWACGTRCVYIPVKYIDNEVITGIIDDLEYYPLLNETLYYELENELTREFIFDHVKDIIVNRLELDDLDDDYLMQVYYSGIDIHGEGVIFETGINPYLDNGFIEWMINDIKKYRMEVDND
jgi:hypothetical protein